MFNVEDESSVLLHHNIVMNGCMSNVFVKILNDDGSNTNIVSSYFFGKNKNYFQLKRKKMSIQH